MMKKKLFFEILAGIFFVACTAELDTFGTSDYHTMNEIHFEEEDGNPSVYAAEHKIVVTTMSVPDSLETWDSLTISEIDISHMASLRLVESKFKEFPMDSLALDSLAEEVSYSEKKLKVGSKIRIPQSGIVYVVILSESGKPSIWQIEFQIPQKEENSSSSFADETSSSSTKTNVSSSSLNANSSSSGNGSSSSAIAIASSSSKARSSSSMQFDSNVTLELEFENALEYQVSDSTIQVVFPEGTDLSTVVLTSTMIAETSTISPDPFAVSDWSEPLEFTVTAEDGSVLIWTVKTAVANALPKILSVSIGSANVPGEIDEESGRIFFPMDYTKDLDLRSLTVNTLALSTGAEASEISEGDAYNFATPKSVTVTNLDGIFKTYTLVAGYQYPNSDFNSWISDAFGNKNDVKYWDNGNNSALTSTKTLTVSAESGTVVKMESKDARILGIGRFASGNMFIGYFNPKEVGTLDLTKYDDGNELIDFGRPFYGRPQYVEFDVKYQGTGDSCDLYVLLENRTAKNNEGKNQYRLSSDVNTLVASAWYRAKNVESTDDPDVVSITDAARSGYKTIRLKLQYGKPDAASPIYNSSVFSKSLKNSAGIDNHLVETDSPDDFDVTHIRVVMASSAQGNVYKGTVGAILYCDEMRLIYE
ncbi:MAG: PCMD domain-containing protein [Fibrobacter sp.]|nr:PCMD domain-containing protein [Fibrobacter sp.]